MTDQAILAGIELGGTKAVALVARGRTILDRIMVPTTDPETTLLAIESWLQKQQFAALGIASFGPLGLAPGQPGHGTITNTPKPGWSGTELHSRFAARFRVPTGFDTDVNAAALAEGLWGASRGCDVHAYVTIGTGVGAGVVANGRPVHGAMHSEFGHVRVRRVAGDGFAGTCPFHGDCLEGLVSGPALARRFGADPAGVAPGDARWDGIAADLAEAFAMLMLTLSPQRIVIGGGVGLGQAHLLPAIRLGVAGRLAGYLPVSAIDVIDVAALGADAGPLGAIALAGAALQDA